MAVPNSAFQSIFVFLFVFIVIAVIQHALMVFLYRNLFIRLKDVKYVGNLIGLPTVFLHEIVGHTIPALLSGSSIIGVDLRDEKGQVAVKYEKNVFGGVSIFIAGFGPTFILPLLFIVLFGITNGMDILNFILEPYTVEKYVLILQKICALNNLGDVLLVLAAIIIAPGAASSSGDVRSVIDFIRESPLITLIMCIVAFFVLYASYEGGFYLSEYGLIIALNTFSAFLVMYIIALLFLFLIIESSKEKRYVITVPVAVLGIISSKFIIPHFVGWHYALYGVFMSPLIFGLLLANAVLLLLKLKK